jgi:hypothetical protein
MRLPEVTEGKSHAVGMLCRGEWKRLTISWTRSGNSSKPVFCEMTMSNPEFRKALASLTFSEKIRILEKLRGRSLAIAARGPQEVACR